MTLMALTLRINLRHPGAGRDPDLPAVVISLDSGLRRNDEQAASKGMYG